MSVASEVTRLMRGVVDALPEGSLEERLNNAHREGTAAAREAPGPTRAHRICISGIQWSLSKLREFQELGHTVVF